jgi:hypothetical protein
VVEKDIPEGLRMGRFWGVGKFGFDGGWADLGTAAGLALEFDAVSIVP